MNIFPIAISTTASYGVPKVMTYLCTAPTHHNESLKCVREKLSNFQQKVECLVGTKVWSTWSDTILDNAWISVLAVSILMSSVCSTFKC